MIQCRVTLTGYCVINRDCVTGEDGNDRTSNKEGEGGFNSKEVSDVKIILGYGVFVEWVWMVCVVIGREGKRREDVSE